VVNIYKHAFTFWHCPGIEPRTFSSQVGHANPYSPLFLLEKFVIINLSCLLSGLLHLASLFKLSSHLTTVNKLHSATLINFRLHRVHGIQAVAIDDPVVSDCHMGELCKSGWTDGYPAWGVVSWGHGKHCIRWGPQPHDEGEGLPCGHYYYYFFSPW